MGYFPTAIQEFVYYDKYARFNTELGRREEWPETIQRVTDFLRELSEDKLSDDDYNDIHNYMLNMQVSPSMRLFATAGDAVRRSNIALFNCAYLPIESMVAVSELLWLSMNGVGVGFSVEEQYVQLLPRIGYQRKEIPRMLLIEDSAEGWVKAFKFGLSQWFAGFDVSFDYSQIRPAGTPLITKGGTASGFQPLHDLFEFARTIILSRQGKRLRPIDVFDICTKVGDCAVSGGSRRVAYLVMFDFDDLDMRHAKAGAYWIKHPHRSNANISAVWTEQFAYGDIKNMLTDMFNGHTGEPGIVSRYAMNKTKPSHRRYLEHGGVNGCSEINLHGKSASGKFGGQTCNLSTVQVYPDDGMDSLRRKVRIATIIGTIQSMATDFKLLRPAWKEICEEERLLGVSLIGHMDNHIVRNADNQRKLRDYVSEVNIEYAKLLGINRAAATTCVKPSGNSSVLYNVARGINARYAPYYIRRVRVNAYTPIYEVLRYLDVPMLPENDQHEPNVNTYVATFYEKSPTGAITTSRMSALEQMEYWKQVKLNWTDHNPSVTIEYSNDEQEVIIDWVYQNQGILNGMAFLPRSNHIYRQAPYEEITEAEYYEAIKTYPEIDFGLLDMFEHTDMTEVNIDCSAGVCDLV